MPGADVAAMYSALLAFSGTGESRVGTAAHACLTGSGYTAAFHRNNGWHPRASSTIRHWPPPPTCLLFRLGIPLCAVYPDQLEYVDRVLQTCHNVSIALFSSLGK